MNQKIIGSFRLQTYGYDYKKTKEFKPISKWYSGEIHYFENGHMTVIVRFAETPKDMTDFVAYSGTYKLTGPEISHHVTESVRPEYIGQTLDRKFTIENDILYTEFENTEDFIKYAKWKRIESTLHIF